MKRLLEPLKAVRRYFLKRQALYRLWKIRFSRESRLKFLAFRRQVSRFIRSPFRSKPALLIGPTNSANQGTLWSLALKRFGILAQSLRISGDDANEWFTSDYALTRSQWLNFEERQNLADMVAATKEIVLFESLRPIFRLQNDKDGRNQIIEDFELMTLMHKRSGVIFHGSDIRNTYAHAARNPFSPFHRESPELEKLRARTAENEAMIPLLRERGIPMFVTTKDLLIDLPDAHWLPVTIDFERFHKVAKESPIFSDPDQKIRVLFLPSRSWLKSADLIEPILMKLRDEGIISYRSYLAEGASLKHSEIPAAMAEADLVIDQFLGVIGVFPIEALAAGRLVMSYIPAEVGEAPIINITPDTLESEIRRVAEQRPIPKAGIDYAREWHDGTQSVLALAEVFGFKI